MLDRITKARPQLSPAARRVADQVLDSPWSVPDANLASLARQAGTSEPTVLRFCRTLGCSGFRDFRLRVAQSLVALDGHAGPLNADVQPDDDAAAVLGKMTSSAIQALSKTRDGISPRNLQRCVNMLSSAATISFWGVGASGIVAEDARHKFFRLGVPCQSCSDGPTMLQSATIAGPVDAIVAISSSGRSGLLLEACAIASRGGAPVIAIAAPGSPLTAAASCALPVDPPDDQRMHTPMSYRLAQLLVVDVLQVGVTLALGEPAFARLARTRRVLHGAR